MLREIRSGAVRYGLALGSFVLILLKTPVSHFEVFPYELESDCSLSGTTQEKLRKSYPVGAKVLVIAHEPKFDGLEDGNVKLVVAPGKEGLLSVATDVDASRADSSGYDYRTYKETEAAQPAFELRKDLLRLSKAQSEEEKVMILKRLVYYPRRFSIDFGACEARDERGAVVNFSPALHDLFSSNDAFVI